jgi:predicted small integral membrane protein
MVLRTAKTVLVAALALHLTMVVFNNLTDYRANFLFTRHVIGMDTTFRDPGVMWRAILSSPLAHLFFGLIILWETATTAVCWRGAWACWRARRGPRADFARAKQPAVIGLTMSLLLWLVGFTTVGGEWFLMWQSKTWNGLEVAFRMFGVTALILIFLAQPEDREQP